MTTAAGTWMLKEGFDHYISSSPGKHDEIGRLPRSLDEIEILEVQKAQRWFYGRIAARTGAAAKRGAPWARAEEKRGTPAGWILLADTNNCTYVEPVAPKIVAMLTLDLKPASSSHVLLTLKSMGGADMACLELGAGQTLGEAWENFVDQLQLRELDRSNLLQIVLPDCNVLGKDKGNHALQILEVLDEQDRAKALLAEAAATGASGQATRPSRLQRDHGDLFAVLSRSWTLSSGLSPRLEDRTGDTSTQRKHSCPVDAAPCAGPWGANLARN